jgi:DNA-3-methyladenine glycosylase
MGRQMKSKESPSASSKRRAKARLTKNFFKATTAEVARALIGQRLVHIVPNADGQLERLSGLIVETEAYLGINDRACHSYGNRRTARTESMYLDAGHAYVFLIYGMHSCFNIVTGSQTEPEAVLIRAVQPEEGRDEMRRRRKNTSASSLLLANGPGKLCQAMALDRSLDRASLLTSPTLFIEKTNAFEPASIVTSPRIGVDYAGADALLPLRFFVDENAHVSLRKRSKPKRTQLSC